MSEARFPKVERRIAGPVDQVLPTLPIDFDNTSTPTGPAVTTTMKKPCFTS